MRLFLDYFFGTMGFAKMVLDVAATNVRAVRSYRSLGFRKVAEHYQPVNHPSFQMLLHDPRYHQLRRYFRSQGLSMQLLFYDMALSREEWSNQSNRPR
jgi:RimJ/RimL family protein N-acetyltransferase